MHAVETTPMNARRLEELYTTQPLCHQTASRHVAKWGPTYSVPPTTVSYVGRESTAERYVPITSVISHHPIVTHDGYS